MSDLIKRDAVMLRVREFIGNPTYNENMLVNDLNALPSAEPERKKGEWVEKTYIDSADYPIPEWQSAKCSVCGKYMTSPYMYYFTDYQFCPNCGTEMSGGE